MLEKLKNFFQKKEASETHESKSDFDALMKKVEEDGADLEKLEKYIREEFGEIDIEVEAMSKRVSELVG